jgi:putative Ig domain-containing protein
MRRLVAMQLRSPRHAAALAGLIVALGAVAAGADPSPQTGPVWPAATAITLPADAQTATTFSDSPFFGPAVALRGVACTSPGNCVGVGGYQDTNGQSDFLAAYVTESAGVWGSAQPLALPPGYSTTVSSQRAYLTSVSCPREGDCVAVGSYTDASDNNQAMIATETAGTWGAAHALTLPANAATMQGLHGAVLYSVSCTIVGDCLAVGSYVDTTNARQPMLVEEDNGVWGAVKTLTLPANANTAPGGQYSRLTSVSCTPASRLAARIRSLGTCVAVGTYIDNSTSLNDLTFVASESNNVWTGTELMLPPDAAATQPTGLDQFDGPAVSCTSAGDCVAVGTYTATTGSVDAMHAEETSGVWGRAVTVASESGYIGVPALLDSVSCTSAGNCTAVGIYFAAGAALPIVVSEVGGDWGDPSVLTPPPDSGAGSNSLTLTGGLDYLTSVACASPTVCVAAGGYAAALGQRAMVISTVSPLAVATTSLPSGVVGSPYSAQLKATGGDGGYTWSVETGALPPGLTLNATTGAITGTPTAAGTSNFTVAVTDPTLAPAGQQATAALSIAITARTSSSGGGTQPGSPSIGKVHVAAPNATVVTVSCHGTASEICTGALALSAVEQLSGQRITAITAAKKTRTVMLGRTDYAVTGGASATVTIKLNATAKRLLSGHHHYPARLTLTATGQTTPTATRTITLAR